MSATKVGELARLLDAVGDDLELLLVVERVIDLMIARRMARATERSLRRVASRT